MAKVSSTARRLFHKQSGLCHYCKVQMTLKRGTSTMVTVDHMHPKSEGGTRHNHNIVGACFACNNAKGSMPYEDYLRVVKKRGRPSNKPGGLPHIKAAKKAKPKLIVDGPGPWKRDRLAHRPYLDTLEKHPTLAEALISAGLAKKPEETT